MEGDQAGKREEERKRRGVGRRKEDGSRGRKEGTEERGKRRESEKIHKVKREGEMKEERKALLSHFSTSLFTILKLTTFL